MLIGVPKEIKDNEFRVGLTPSSVAELIHNGHKVLVQTGAGLGSGLSDEEYVAAGAAIVSGPGEIFERADMVVKVKEPLAAERKMLRPGQVLFTYLHLAPDLQQTKDLIASRATCIAYETVTSPSGGLPLLTPMSEVAGRLAPQVGAHCLEKEAGGRGVLLGGVPGVPAGEVIILGGGVSGTHAATIALGMGANVTVVDRNPEALRRLAFQFNTGVRTIFSTRSAIAEIVKRADLLIGAVLVPGAAAPKLVTREMVATMKPGAVIVDIAIDQGGCCETSRPTIAFRSDLRGRRRRALLRHQHAGRGRAHLHLRAQQRHAAVRAGARRQGPEGGDDRRPASARRPERARRPDHLQAGRRSARSGVDGGRGRAEHAGDGEGGVSSWSLQRRTLLPLADRFVHPLVEQLIVLRAAGRRPPSSPDRATRCARSSCPDTPRSCGWPTDGWA